MYVGAAVAHIHDPVVADAHRREQLDVALQPNALANLNEVMAPNAAVLRIVQQKISEFAALLHKMDVSEAVNSFPKAGYAQQFAQNDPGVVETERLVEIADQ